MSASSFINIGLAWRLRGGQATARQAIEAVLTSIEELSAEVTANASPDSLPNAWPNAWPGAWLSYTGMRSSGRIARGQRQRVSRVGKCSGK